MLSARASLLLAFTAIVTAAPYQNERRWGHWGGGWRDHARSWWSGEDDSSSSSSSSSLVEFSKRLLSGTTLATCDLSQASMPQSPIPLPGPPSGLTLAHVALGRGTQNYTCDPRNATASPVPAGALATLFNVSCIAADAPALFATLPDIALNLPAPDPATTDPSSPASLALSGHHYFLDATTPFFNLDTAQHSYGTGAFKKANASAAPTDAPRGPGGSGDGSVAWLKLDAKDDGAGQPYQEVYRTNTAGGSPPEVCAGLPPAFEVQYAAAYWLYTKSG